MLAGAYEGGFCPPDWLPTPRSTKLEVAGASELPDAHVQCHANISLKLQI